MVANVSEIVADIKSARIERVRKVPVFKLLGSATELLPPGSGMLIITSQSRTFENLERSLRQQDKEAIDQIVAGIKEEIGRRAEVDLECATQSMRTASVIADLYFGVKPLVVNAFLPEGVYFGRGLFVYAGGSYGAHEFKLAEYALSEDERPLRALVVLHEPTLSDRERMVLNMAPEASRGMIFGPADPVMFTPAAAFATVTAGIIVALVGTALGHCAPRFDGIDEIVLPEITPGSAASVKALLAARRAALGRV